MSFNPRVHKKNNIKYSTSHTNALLNLAQTQAAETIILENMLQSRLDKIEKAKKKSKKFGAFSKIVSKIIPGKVDDAILGIANAAFADRQRAKAYGGIDIGQVSLLKDAAREINSQALEFSEELMKDMTFRAGAKKLISDKMIAQIGELPEIKKLKENFNALSFKEQLKPKNLMSFVKGSSEVTANFMKNPIGFMKRYERDPITKELQYKGTSALNKFFSSSIEADRKTYQNEFNRLRKEAGLDMSVYSMLETPREELQIRMPSIDEQGFPEGFAKMSIPSAADVVSDEIEVEDLLLDRTLLDDVKEALPEPTRPAIELSKEIEDMADDLPVEPDRPIIPIPSEEPDIAPDMSLEPMPERPSVAMPSEELEDIEGDMLLPQPQREIGGGAFQTNLTYDPVTLQPIYGTSYMNYAVDSVGDTLSYQTPEFKSTDLGFSRSSAQNAFNLTPLDSLLSVTQPPGMSVDELQSQFAGFNEPFTQQQMFDRMSRRDQRRFRRNNPNMFGS